MPIVRAVSHVSTELSHTAAPSSRGSTVSTHATTTTFSVQSATAAPSVERSHTAVPSSRSSTVATHATTTTVSVQSAAPATDAPQRVSHNLPVGVFVGSIVGGVVLAIVALLGWIYWGKSFRRRQRDEVRTVLTTKDDTHGHSSRRAQGLKKPLLIRSPEEKQHLERNVSPDSANEKADAYNRMHRVSAPDSVEPTHQLSPPQLVFNPAKISQPRTLRKNRRLKQLIDRKPPLSPIADVDNEAVDASLEEPSVDPFADTNALIVNAPVTVSHKPSTIGSASVYSTESGEERQHMGDPSFNLAALGPPGLDTPLARPPPSISRKLSNVSSIYSCQSGEERDFGVPSNSLATLDQDRKRFTAYAGSSRPLDSAAKELPSAWVRPGARKAREGDETLLSRLSQVSSVSAYSS